MAAPRKRMRTTTAPRSLLRPLGVVGYGALEPALLAALATEEPLLLVSDHGAAKTLLLVRLAGALGLALRHYNASILQFDDLIGFPIPMTAALFATPRRRHRFPRDRLRTRIGVDNAC